jgi:hypothetical protein
LSAAAAAAAASTADFHLKLFFRWLRVESLLQLQVRLKVFGWKDLQSETFSSEKFRPSTKKLFFPVFSLHPTFPWRSSSSSGTENERRRLRNFDGRIFY